MMNLINVFSFKKYDSNCEFAVYNIQIGKKMDHIRDKQAI